MVSFLCGTRKLERPEKRVLLEKVTVHQGYQPYLQKALRKSLIGDSGAPKAWQRLHSFCAQNEISFVSVICRDEPGGMPLEQVLAIRDGESAQFFMKSLSDGSYANGRILKTAEGLYCMRDGKANGPGLRHIGSRSFYCGQFKDSKRHGIGKTFYPDGDNYEGEWVEGRRHGRGILYGKYHARPLHASFENGGQLMHPK